MDRHVSANVPDKPGEFASDGHAHCRFPISLSLISAIVGDWFKVGGALSQSGQFDRRRQQSKLWVPFAKQCLKPAVEHGAAHLEE